MKKISLFLVLLLLFTCSVAYAANLPRRGTKIADELKLKEAGTEAVVGIDAVTILGVMQWIGYGLAIGMIIFTGIKYVMSGAGEKAKAKETLVPILIGAIILASAVTITEVAFSIFGK